MPLGFRLRQRFVLIPFIALALTSFQADSNSRRDPLSGTRAINPTALVNEMAQHEIDAHNDDLHWKYRSLSEAGGRRELRDVIQTNDGEIDRLLAVNGQPLTAAQEETEEKRIERLVSEPAQAREKREAFNEDVERVKQLLRMLPTAFRYDYAGIDNSGLVELQFTPNPDFYPSGRLGRVFQHLEGTMWIDTHQKRLARIDGRLTSEVKFGWGLFGHLDQGGKFSVLQEDFGSGHWEVAALDIDIGGKALLFKSINFREKETFGDFEVVPREITLREAADMLKQGETAPDLRPPNHQQR